MGEKRKNNSVIVHALVIFRMKQSDTRQGAGIALKKTTFFFLPGEPGARMYIALLVYQLSLWLYVTYESYNVISVAILFQLAFGCCYIVRVAPDWEA